MSRNSWADRHARRGVAAVLASVAIALGLTLPGRIHAQEPIVGDQQSVAQPGPAETVAPATPPAGEPTTEPPVSVATTAVASPGGTPGDTAACNSTLRATHVPKCDVAVTDIRGTAANGTVTIVATVANKGESATPSLSVTSPWETKSAAVGFLGRSETRDIEVKFAIPVGWPAGDAPFEATANNGRDASPGDNTRSTTVPLPPGPTPEQSRPPDLAVAPAEPASRAVGDTLTVRVTVANQGAKTASSKLTLSWPYAAPRTIDTGAVPPHKAVVKAMDFAIPGAARGTRPAFTATVAPLDRETDLADNRREFDVPIPAVAPDLAVTAAGVLPQRTAGAVVLQLRVRNVGAAEAARTRMTVRAPWGGDAIRHFGPLAAGGGRTLHLELSVPPGARGTPADFRVRATPVDGEQERANNSRRTGAVPLLAPPPPPGNGGPPLWSVLVVAALLAAGAGAWALRRRPGGHGIDDGPAPVAWVPEREIVTGFASAAEPETLLPPGAPLVAGATYYFCIEVGPPLQDANGAAPPIVDVALFCVGGDVGVRAGADRGALQLVHGASAAVAMQPGDERIGGVGDDTLARRLFFPVRPTAAGGSMRVSLYRRNVLLWSQRIDVPALRGTGPGSRYRATTDFGIAPALDARQLEEMPEHKLSVLLNHDDGGTHALTFKGDDGFQAALTLSPDELQEMLGELRGGLRYAAWGNDLEWEKGRSYRYSAPNAEQLRTDLVRMAVRGGHYYDFLTQKLDDAELDWKAVRTSMRTPGLVQVASRESPSQLFPASLIYDHPIDDTQPNDTAFTLCPEFLQACSRPGLLASARCFGGDCPHWGERTVVCPSGFWGFRHRLGTTLSTRGGRDIALTIGHDGPPRVLMAVSTDPDFGGRVPHEEALRKLCGPEALDRAATRKRTLELLKEGRAHLVYFYCHGGMKNHLPILHVGPLSGPVITSSYLREEGIEWTAPRPLVFLNGCRTTAVEPRHALHFVGGWLKHSHAAGVLGTEITVFEPLASAFAEAALERFLQGEALGEAVLGARLALLKHLNPLGLAYVAFAMAALRLTASPRDTAGTTRAEAADQIRD